jgi:NAD(P)-dependent dehydrogenase (short-subunit alcohol dehydrogenase family)
MAKIFITGSTDGIGFLAAEKLIKEGHDVVLHARNAERAAQVREKLSSTEKVLVADLSSLEETKRLAAEVNALGRFDAVIHNAGVYQVSKREIFAVNTLAPYVLTCLIERPNRLIYIGSGMHLQGDATLNNLSLDTGASYSDSKLHVLMLSMAAARKWPEVYVNTVDPGWVPTKMGGSTAPDDLQKGAETQAWLAVSDDAAAKVSGQYLFHQKEAHYFSKAADVSLQERLLTLCKEISGVRFPAHAMGEMLHK